MGSLDKPFQDTDLRPAELKMFFGQDEEMKQIIVDSITPVEFRVSQKLSEISEDYSKKNR